MMVSLPFPHAREFAMVICPIAIAVGCRKCPIFKVCPVKSVIGDYREPAAVPLVARAAAIDTKVRKPAAVKRARRPTKGRPKRRNS